MNNDNNNNHSSEQNNDVATDFAIPRMKEHREKAKKLHAPYQDVFNIFDPLPSRNNENKCGVLLELDNNSPSMDERNHSHRR